MTTATSLVTGVLSEQVKHRRKALRRAVLAWAPTAARRYAWRQHGRSAYEILIAELLLKRTTSTAAARVYEDFIARFPSFGSLETAPHEVLEAALVTVGLQRQRAKALRELAAFVMEQWDGELPDEVQQLVTIPHVGPYAAGAIRSFAFGLPAAIVDSNVERIIKRLLRDSIPERLPPSLLQQVAERLLPADRHREFNLGLLDLGALVCRYVRPKCVECPLVKSCDFGRQPRPES